MRKTSDLTLLDGLDIEYRYGDVTTPETLPDMVQGVSHVVHNAGVVKARRRETFFSVNEKGTQSLMDAVAAHNPQVKRIVYISSLAAAGPSQIGRPHHEGDPTNPVTTYGESKLAGERVTLSYADRLPLVIVRPPGVYGPGDREMFTVFQTVNKGIRPRIGDQSRRLQVVHVDDLCEGVVKAVTVEVESGSVYYVAENRGYSMEEFIDCFVRGSGRRCLPLPVPGWLFVTIAAVSEMSCKLVGTASMLNREKTRELLASWEVGTSKARDELGYESAIELERGVRETFEWYRKMNWL